MKKSLSLLAVLAIAGAMSSQAQAADRYVSGLAGISWMNDINAVDTFQASDAVMTIATDGGFSAVGAFGCDYGSTRAELELGYQHNSLTGASGVYWVDTQGEDWASPAEGSVNILSLMVNGYYDIPLGKGAEVYAMAGVGGAQVTFKDVNIYASPYPPETADQTTLAWQVGAGVAIPVGDKVKLDLRYRYFATTDFEFDEYAMANVNENFYGEGRMHVSSHSLLAGIRVNL
ncbi:MAG: porin family protein [Chlorobiaceae bacterium]|nr:porin family protein [Chlorobiaceae bacterium]